MISPMQVGQTLPTWNIPFIDTQQMPIALSGTPTFQLIIHDTLSHKERTGTGTFTIADAVNGLGQYAWSTADVSIAGSYLLYATLVYGAGLRKFLPISWTVQARGHLTS